MESQELIERLKENKSICVRKNYFGTDNHAMIDIMIEVIESDMEEDEIYDRWEDEEEELSAALSARSVLDGEENIEEILYPEA